MPAMTITQLKRAVEIGFVLDADAQSTHIENAAREVMRYGRIVRNVEWENKTARSVYEGFHRIRTVEYLGHEWRHVMHNGRLMSLSWKKV